MGDGMKEEISLMLRGIERYNPENLKRLEQYVEYQVQENQYNLEANLAVLKLYQFNPTLFKSHVVVNILLKSLTNLPHTDFVLCKCLIDLALFPPEHDTKDIKSLFDMHGLLETCQFGAFWKFLNENKSLWSNVIGFEIAIRKYISHIVNITYQRIPKNTLEELLGITAIDATILKQNNWTDAGNGDVFISNQDESIKTKNITEKIDFDSVAKVIAAYK